VIRRLVELVRCWPSGNQQRLRDCVLTRVAFDYPLFNRLRLAAPHRTSS
jgi:hypothetical protein